MSKGNFFEKRAGCKDGKFFQNMPGRTDGQFNKAAIKSGKSLQKKAEDPIENHAPGEHRPASEQPRELNAGGGRFLEGSSGPVAAPISGLNTAKLKKQGSDLRFMGTSFEKRARGESSPDVIGHAGKDLKGLPGGASEVASRAGTSAHRGLDKAWGAGADAVRGAADKVSGSPLLSLLAIGLGGYGAARGIKGLAGKIARGGRKAKAKTKPGLATGVLAKIKGR